MKQSTADGVANLSELSVSLCIYLLCHRIRIHRRATRVGASEVFEAAHVALVRAGLGLFQIRQSQWSELLVT